jgi:hypothetical protein
MGWKIMPLWDDLQAPPGCVGAHEHMSDIPSTAYAQGQTSARNAQAAMSAFGFATNDTVWLDIEGYSYTGNSNPGGRSCQAAVNQYITGWDSILGGSVNDAGVYGSSVGSQVYTWASLTSVPNFVWIADSNLSPNSVWNINPVGGAIPNGWWVNDQRIHQYHLLKAYNYPTGCTGNQCLTVDVDCINTYVDGPNLLATSDDDTYETNETNSVTAEPYCNGSAQ